jgi:hypothetical protein
VALFKGRDSRRESSSLRASSFSSRANHRFCRTPLAKSLRLEPLEDRRMLAVLTVDTDQDVVDFNDGVTSLREAIFAANVVPGADEIVFDLGAGPKTILLTQGELKITDSLTITGSGAELLTIDAQQQSRIFNVIATNGDMSFSGMTLTNGFVSSDGSVPGGGALHSASTGLVKLTDMSFIANRTAAVWAEGGAVFATRDLQIDSSRFLNNSTVGFQAHGGAVVAQLLTITGSSFTDNQTMGDSSFGGAISSFNMISVNSVYSGNKTMGQFSSGGAIQAHMLSMASSEVTGNITLGQGASGGGIQLSFGGRSTPSYISNSVISNNNTLGNGSAGGGISTSNKVTVEWSTISGNFTAGDGSLGGGLFAYTAVINDSLFESNQTFGLNSGGGGAFASSYRPNWKITDSTFSANKTFGGGSRGGAIASTSGVTIADSSFQNNGTYGPQTGGGALSITGNWDSSISTSSFVNNATNGGGGGAISAQRNITITDSILTGNRSTNGGGAIDHTGYSATMTIIRGKVSNNEAIGQNITGGGIRSQGIVKIMQSEISGNRIVGGSARGGGVFSQALTTIIDSTVSGNHIIGSFGQGGGLFALNPANIVSSTISGNQITGSQAEGGGVLANRELSLQHSTVAGNRIENETGKGGGVFSRSIQPSISYSILAGNLVGLSAADLASAETGNPSLRYSLIGSNAGTGLIPAPVGSPDANGNLIGVSVSPINPLLGPLADNAGPTKTHKLLDQSPAIDAGDPSLVLGQNGVPEFDQRGAPFTRIAGGRIDIGAYESQPDQGTFVADFDDDGDVDGRDLLIWQRGFGRSGPEVERQHGDATGDHDVDANDLAVWQATYDKVPAPGIVAALSVEREDSLGWLADSGITSLAAMVQEHDPGDEPSVELIDQVFAGAQQDSADAMPVSFEKLGTDGVPGQITKRSAADREGWFAELGDWRFVGSKPLDFRWRMPR